MKSSKFILYILLGTVAGIILYSRGLFQHELEMIRNNTVMMEDQYIPQLHEIIQLQEKMDKVSILVMKYTDANSAEKQSFSEEEILFQLQEINEGLQSLAVKTNQTNAAALYSYIFQHWTDYQASVRKVLYAVHQYDEKLAQEERDNSIVYLERLCGGMMMVTEYHQNMVKKKAEEQLVLIGTSVTDVNVFAGVTTTIFLIVAITAFMIITSTENKLRIQINKMQEKNLLLEEQGEEIHRLAFYDHLTGLANRYQFQEIAAKELVAFDGEVEGAIIFLDVDNFKMINDTYGHDVGDLFLVQISQQLRTLAERKKILAARFGGDEFALWLRNIGPKEINDFLAELVNYITAPIIVQDVILNSTCSVGVVFYPSQGTELGDLLKKADIAMYHAKNQKNKCVIYEDTLLEETTRRHIMEYKLREVIEKEALFLMYQPILALESNVVVGMEALVRWQDEEYGLVLPAQFIPIAESRGLIHSIGEWVLNKAAQMIHKLDLAEISERELFMSVNISALQIHQDNFSEVLEKVLLAQSVSYSRLKVELTESMLIESFSRAQNVLRQIGGRGVQICLDDFGTGYSSIHYLTRLPIHYLKIDRVLVNDLGHDPSIRVIFENLIRMAHGIGVKVIAEGVETIEQLEIIKKLGCDYAQGYYISRPLREDQLLQFLHEQSLSKEKNL